MPDVVMPRLSDSMEEGTILKWLKADGDEVARGDELVEIETDKATATYAADAEGTLKIVAQEGETLAVGAVIAALGRDGARSSAPVEPAPADVPRVGPARGEVTVEEPTRAQQVVARRIAESKATIPELTLSVDADMEAAAALRAQLEEAGREPVPTIDDLVVKAAALALREHPRANASYRDGRFELHDRVNVGVAIAAHDALVVPTIFDADRKSLDAIARHARALAERVRANAITPPELGGATFTVSSLSDHGIASFTAVINPPQAAILAIGAMQPTPVAREGAVVVHEVMRLTLTCDHRILYGAQAADFLGRIRSLLERPLVLAL
jgi:pyruvate dehydrogenase E2 component (dihydrolipoamide acetyltransferase)